MVVNKRYLGWNIPELPHGRLGGGSDLEIFPTFHCIEFDLSSRRNPLSLTPKMLLVRRWFYIEVRCTRSLILNVLVALSLFWFYSEVGRTQEQRCWNAVEDKSCENQERPGQAVGVHEDFDDGRKDEGSDA